MPPPNPVEEMAALLAATEPQDPVAEMQTLLGLAPPEVAPPTITPFQELLDIQPAEALQLRLPAAPPPSPPRTLAARTMAALPRAGLTAIGVVGKALDIPHRALLRVPGHLLGQMADWIAAGGDVPSFREALRHTEGGLPQAITEIISPEWEAAHPTATKAIAYGAGIPLEMAGDVALGLGAAKVPVKGATKLGLRLRRVITPSGWKGARKVVREAGEAAAKATKKARTAGEIAETMAKTFAKAPAITDEAVEAAARLVRRAHPGWPDDAVWATARSALEGEITKPAVAALKPTGAAARAAAKRARQAARPEAAKLLFGRKAYAVPGTEKITKTAAEIGEAKPILRLKRAFTPEGEPVGRLAKEAWRKGAEPAGAEASFRSLVEADPRARDIVKMDLADDELARASIASEFYKQDPRTGKYAIPKGLEAKYAAEMKLSPAEEIAAGRIAEMQLETGAVRKALGIPTGEPAPKLTKAIGKIKAREIPRVRRRLRERVAEQLGARIKKGKRLIRVAEKAEVKTEKAIGRAVLPVKKRAVAVSEKAAKAQLDDAAAAMARSRRARAAGHEALAKRLQADASEKSRAILSAQSKALGDEAAQLDGLASQIEAGKTLTTVKPELRKAFPKTRAGAEQYAQTAHNLKDAYAARAAAKTARTKADRLLAMGPEHARLEYAELLSRSKKLARLTAKAQALDAEVTRIPGYFARTIAKEHRLGLAAAGGKGVIGLPRAHGLSGATKARAFTVKSGRPMYLWEIEKELRRAAYDPEYTAKHPYLRDLTSQLQDTGVWKKVKDVAAKQPTEKLFVKGLYELNPIRSVQTSIARNINDAKQVGFIKALGEFAEAKPKPGWVPAKQMGDVAAQAHAGKYFPPEVAHEVKRVMSNIAGIDNKALRAYDRVLKVWRQSVTSPFPAFHVRNAYSDMILMAANGPYDPIKVHRFGLRAVYGKGTIKVRGLGSIDAREARLMADAYGVTWGRMSLEGEGGVIGRITNIPEETRRIGYFLERVDTGMSPMQAALETKKVLFDYSRLGPLERKALRRVIPFWSWTRHSVPFTLKTTLTKPYWTSAQLRLIGAGRRKAIPEEQLPSYMQKSMHISLSQPGLSTVIYGIGFPIADTMNLIDGAGKPTELLKDLWWQLSPVIKEPAKLGVRVGTGRTMRDMVSAPRGAENLSETTRDILGIRQEGKRYVMPRWRREILRPLRFASELFRVARAETPEAAFLAFVTGLSKLTYTETQLLENAVTNQVRALQTQLEAEGKTREFVVKPAVPSAKRDPRVLELKRLRRIQKRLRKRTR